MVSDKKYTLAVVVPFWNCEAYIGELLDCLVEQTFTDWKAFFVDDNCTDGSAGIVREYANRDPRVRLVLRDRAPKGAPTCRNIGMEQSREAEYLVFLDADDLITPDCFAQRVRFMQAHPSVDFASFPMKAFKTDKNDDTYWGFGVPGRQELLPSLLYWKTLQIVVPSNIYRRERLTQAGVMWDECLHSMQDADFNIQSLTRGLRHAFDVDARIDYYYRQSQGTVSKRISAHSMFSSHLYLVGKVISAVRGAFGTRYDFSLRAYIVNFFGLFRNNKDPYLSLRKMDFVKRSPAFFSRITLYLLLGMRGKNVIFRKYTAYSGEAARTWASIVSDTIRKKVKKETIHG